MLFNINGYYAGARQARQAFSEGVRDSRSENMAQSIKEGIEEAFRWYDRDAIWCQCLWARLNNTDCSCEQCQWWSEYLEGAWDALQDIRQNLRRAGWL